MNQLVELLKSNNYQIRKELLFNYKSLNITDSELIVIIYLLNQNSDIYNPKQICNDLKLELNNVLELINSLTEKGVLKIELKKINNIRTEVINFDTLYEKIVFSLEPKQEEKTSTIYDIFEIEFGRTLSPMEYEIITGWVDSGYTEELITLALKEATYNGVSNLRYIDKIIYEWGKKGIKTKEDVEKNKKQFKQKEEKKEIFDYNWLDEENDN